MRNGRINQHPKVSELETAAPPVPAVEALRHNLLYAMFNSVSEGDMAEIVQKQVELAKEGDAKAAKLLMDMIQAEPPQQVFMQQAVVHQGSGDTLDVLRREIVDILATEGPKTIQYLRQQLGCRRVIQSQMVEVMEHEWFEHESDGYHLTARARAELLEKNGD
jgi:hypothetical protein